MSAPTTTRHQNELAAFAEWEWNCAQLTAFFLKRGHCDLGEHPLAEWVRRQRAAAVAGRLSEERMGRLAALGVSFDPQDDAWNLMFRRVCRCLRLQRVRSKKDRSKWTPGPPDEDLAGWLAEQRRLHTQGLQRKDRLRRLQKLKVLGKPQELKPEEEGDLKPARQTVAWDARHRELCDFHNQHGHTDVPKGHPPNPSLANWVSMQRVKGKQGRLLPSQIERLNHLGFNWLARRSRSERAWDHQLEQLKAFKQEHGHVRGVKEMDRKLFRWMYTQRGLRREGILSKERIARLDAIGFIWSDPRLQGLPSQVGWERRWDYFFEQLKAFQKQRGHTLVPANWRENKDLATWVAEQRKARRKGSLPARRLRRLEQIHFEWNPPGRKRVGPPPPKPEHRYHALWNRMFAQMQAYQEKHGHTCVPRGVPALKSLAAWRFTQQERRRLGRLSAERVARLDSIGFQWEAPGRNGRTRKEFWQGKWDAKYEELARFRSTHGHCRLSAMGLANSKLSKWTFKQRAAKKRGDLDPRRAALLDALGFDWGAS